KTRPSSSCRFRTRSASIDQAGHRAGSCLSEVEWSSNLLRYLAATGITNETQKRQILLYTAGKEVSDLYSEIITTETDTTEGEPTVEPTVDQLIALFTKHFQGRDNIVFLRYQFRQCVQDEGESIDAWHSRLWSASEACQFESLRYSLVRDQIVASCRSESLRKRLLNIPNINLADTLQLARTHEAAEKQAAIMSRTAAASEEVAQVRRQRYPPPELSRQPQPSAKCIRCGESGHRSCNRAQGKRCTNCGKFNHLAKACLSRSKINALQPEQDQLADQPVNEVFCTLSGKDNSAKFPISINGQQVCTLIDSGASCNVLDMATFRRICRRGTPLAPSSTRVFALGASEPLEAAGQTTLTVRANHRELQANFIVIRSSCTPILGRASSTKLGMLRVGPEACTNSAVVASLANPARCEDQHLPKQLQLESILADFSDRFQGIGCVKGVTITIKLRSDASPVCQPPSRVPVHLRAAVIKELEEQLALGIIERVHGPTAWCSRMVAVPKAEQGEVRITQDLREVNKYVIPEKQPIPTFEEVTDEMAGSTYFSELDVAKAFHQIEVAEESRDLLTFSTPIGLLRLRRLCMGYTSASEILQRPLPMPPNNVGEQADAIYVATAVRAATPVSISLTIIKAASDQDSTVQAALHAIRGNQWDKSDTRLQGLHGVAHELSELDGLLLCRSQLYMPTALRYRCLQLAHQGHQGVRKTLDRLQPKVWWPGMRASVEAHVAACISCQACTRETAPKSTPLKPTELPEGPWLELGLDFLGPVSGKSLLVCTDHFSRFPLVEVMPSTTASAVTKVLRRWFSIFGQPTKVTTDNGPPFASAEFSSFLADQGARHHRITPLYPQANGATERCNQGLNKAIRAAVLEGRDWTLALDEYLAAYRRTPHCATGVAPASLLFGRQINDVIPSLQHSQPIDATRAAIADRDRQAKEEMKRLADQRSRAADHAIRPGDRVLRRLQSRQKTDAFYEPVPWTVAEVQGDSLLMQRDEVVCRRHATQVKRLSEQPKQGQFTGMPKRVQVFQNRVKRIEVAFAQLASNLLSLRKFYHRLRILKCLAFSKSTYLVQLVVIFKPEYFLLLLLDSTGEGDLDRGDPTDCCCLFKCFTDRWCRFNDASLVNDKRHRQHQNGPQTVASVWSLLLLRFSTIKEHDILGANNFGIMHSVLGNQHPVTGFQHNLFAKHSEQKSARHDCVHFVNGPRERSFRCMASEDSGPSELASHLNTLRLRDEVITLLLQRVSVRLQLAVRDPIGPGEQLCALQRQRPRQALGQQPVLQRGHLLGQICRRSQLFLRKFQTGFFVHSKQVGVAAGQGSPGLVCRGFLLLRKSRVRFLHAFFFFEIVVFPVMPSSDIWLHSEPAGEAEATEIKRLVEADVKAGPVTLLATIGSVDEADGEVAGLWPIKEQKSFESLKGHESGPLKLQNYNPARSSLCQMKTRIILKGAEQEFQLSAKVTTIGCRGCGINIQAKGVETQHATIEVSDEDGGLILRDLDTECGTLVNDCLVQNASVRVVHGDRLRFGEASFQLLTVTDAPAVSASANSAINQTQSLATAASSGAAAGCPGHAGPNLPRPTTPSGAAAAATFSASQLPPAISNSSELLQRRLAVAEEAAAAAKGEAAGLKTQLQRLIGERTSDATARREESEARAAELASAKRMAESARRDAEISGCLAGQLREDLSARDSAISRLNKDIDTLKEEVKSKDLVISTLQAKSSQEEQQQQQQMAEFAAEINE
uniref:Endonuclease n=1 Tax=Macrostomum lignano TaxID=282301 RepID=A0A1I8IPR4_9PLAT